MCPPVGLIRGQKGTPVCKDFERISNDELYERLGEARHDAVVRGAGISEDEYIEHNAQLDWEVQTRAGQIEAVLAPVKHYDE